jgi:hypothetical protein
MSTFPIPFDEAEAVRYFGARPEDKEAHSLVNQVFLSVKDELQPRSIHQLWHCDIVQGTAEHPGKVQISNGMAFTGTQLAKHLKGCSQLILLGATLGSRFDLALRRLSLRSIAEGAAAQAVGTALIETYIDEQEKIWKQELPSYYTYRTRFSPGYGDWPLEDQRKIFRVLDCAKRIGLTLTEGGLMAPLKSVTAIIGVDTSGACSEEPEKRGCASCAKTDCAFRRS